MASADSLTTNVDVNVNAVKPGVRATELWLSALAVILGTVLEILGLLQDQHPVVKVAAIVVGGAVQVLSALGYNAGRVRLKATGLAALASALRPDDSPRPSEPARG